MSLRFQWLVCCACLLVSACSGFAADRVHLVSLEGRVEPASHLPAVFGNHEEKLNLEVGGVVAQTASLRADLFQVVGGLAMPLSKDIHLQEGIAFVTASPQRLGVSIKFPEVKGRAEILVHLALFPSIQQTTLVPLGDIRFEVFPANVTKELTDLLKPKSDGSSSVVLFGPGQRLRHFLAALHVNFEDGGTGIPDRFDPNRLYFGELSNDERFQQAQDQSAGARMVLFSPDESLPAGVYAERSNSGVLIHVTSQLLDNLIDDPRAQLGLTKVIHLLSAPPPSANRVINL